jgi:hypothetical protein
VENCLKDGVLGEAPNFARDVNARGARRARDWRAGNRKFLVAVRTPRLIVDIVSIDFERGDF